MGHKAATIHLHLSLFCTICCSSLSSWQASGGFWPTRFAVASWCPSLSNLGKCVVNPSDSSAFDFHDNILAISFSVNGSEIKSNIHCLQTLTSIVLNLTFYNQTTLCFKSQLLSCWRTNNNIASLTSLKIFSCAENFFYFFCSFFSYNYAYRLVS